MSLARRRASPPRARCVVDPEYTPRPAHCLTPAQDAFIDEIVKSGDYQNASEAVRDALRVLQQQRRENALRLKALRAQLKRGLDALDRGAAVAVEDADLKSYLTSLVAPQRKRTRAR